MELNKIGMQSFRKTRIFIGTVIVGIAFGGCDRDRNHPGWDYFPDMFYSTAYETYTPNPNFADGKTMREPVKGTVSREMTPFGYSLEEGERVRAGKELVNPIKSSEEILAQGKQSYTIFCAGCHGADGNGSGRLYTSGLYPLQPRSLVNEVGKNLKDGEIYHTITLGFGSMGPHGSQVTPENRWKIISYIREDLQKNFTAVADTVKVK